MPFAFRLERVLSVRRLQEETAQQRHAEAVEACRRADAARADLENQLVQTLEELDGLKHRDELTSQALYLHSLHASGVRRAIQTAWCECERCSAELELRAAELMEAHRAREALEKLRDREHDAWQLEQNRREAKLIDDIAVSRRRAREEENHGP